MPKQGEKKEGVASVNIILKTDTLGSLEAIVTALLALQHPEVRLSIVSKELGTITTADVLTAEATRGFIAGFHVPISTSAAEIAAEKNVQIKTYKIIYELLDDVKEMIELLIKPETRRTVVGLAKILAIFRTEAKSMIVGAVVLEGNVKQKTRASILRKDTKIGEGMVAKVRSGKTEIESAQSGQECGIAFESKQALEVGDSIELYEEETVKRGLAS
jgi:translation initiation factor IF-2